MFPEGVEVGEKIIVICLVRKGAQPIEINWYIGFEDKLASTIEGVSTHHSREMKALDLIIERADLKYAGNYTCTARNQFGSDSYSSSLIINGSFVIKFRS